MGSELRVVDVWTIDLTQCGRIDSLHDLLSEQEKMVAGRFRFDQLRQRYIVAHAATRLILSDYAGVAAKDLQFQANAYGKPFLANGAGPVFNLSHSDDAGLIAVTSSGVLGVDIERCRETAPLDLVDRFFSAIERETFARLATEKKNDGFFACWTRKEAYIKAKGLGLSLPLETFSVEAHPDLPARLIASDDAPEDVGRFQFWDVPVAKEFRAAVAYCGEKAGLSVMREWSF